MDLFLTIIIALFFSAGMYLMLRRSVIKLVFGLFLLSHASNLFIFGIGRLTRGYPPLIKGDETALLQPYADPLPQALILTAIVIGFGVQAFAVVLLGSAHRAVGSDDLDRMNTTDALPKLPSA